MQSDIPVVGDNIRTKKMSMEGKVIELRTNRAGYDEVVFEVSDGRKMKTPLENVIVVEKLADEDIMESNDTEKQIRTRIRQIMYDRTLSGTESNSAELNSLKQKLKDLLKNKPISEEEEKVHNGMIGLRVMTPDGPGTVLHVDEGQTYNLKSGNMKDAGINVMCIVELDKPIVLKSGKTRKMNPYFWDEMDTIVDSLPARMNEGKFQYDKKTGKMGYNTSDPDQRHGIYVNNKLVKTYPTKEEAEKASRDPRFKGAIIKKIAEGSMGGINRCAPSNDVSYEKVLDDDINSIFESVKRKWKNIS